MRLYYIERRPATARCLPVGPRGVDVPRPLAGVVDDVLLEGGRGGDAVVTGPQGVEPDEILNTEHKSQIAGLGFPELSMEILTPRGAVCCRSYDSCQLTGSFGA